MTKLTPESLEIAIRQEHRRPSTFAALSVRDYRWYWFSSLGSFFAAQMQQPTQLWLVYQLTHSALALGVVSLAQGVPQFVTNLFSGVIIDRVQKRNIIIVTQAVSLFLVLGIAILITMGQIQYWHLVLTSFLTGINSAFNLPARNSIAAELVPKDRLYNAIALSNSAMNSARIGGPALAGVLIGTIGIQGAYYIGAIFNVMGITTISFLPRTSKLDQISGGSLINNLKDGMKYLYVNFVILTLLGMELAITFFGLPYQSIMPVFADLLKANPTQYGFMMSAVGIGALIGSLGIASLGNLKRKGLLMLSAGIVLGVLLIIFSNTEKLGVWLNLGANSYYLALPWLMFIGVSGALYTATSLTLIQLLVSDEFRGRVISAYQMVIALFPIAVTILGAGVQVLGAGLALTISGICLIFFMSSMMLFNPRIRRL